jgi:hypothetical protein
LIWFDLVLFCFVLFLGAEKIGEMGMEECELWTVRAGPREGGGCEIKKYGFWICLQFGEGCARRFELGS